MTTSTEPATPSDPDAVALKRLQNQVARLNARLGVTGLLAPGVDDGPTGTITLGEKAGALGPWLAHDVLARAAGAMADAARPKVADGIVLVTDDPALLRGHLLSHQVHLVIDHHRLSLDVEQLLAGVTPTAASGGPVQLPSATGQAVLAAAGDVPEEVKEEEQEEEEEDDEPTPAAAAAPLAVALGLLRLSAVDHSLAAVEVTASSAVLARLTAGHLGSGGTRVVVDGFGAADPQGRTLTALADLQARLRTARARVAVLVRDASALAAQVEALTLDVTKAQADWVAAVQDEKSDAVRRRTLRAELDRLRRQLADRTAQLAPAQAVAAHVTALVAAAEADLVALTTADSTGTTPLLRACSREGLHVDADRPADDRRLTHVLHVEVSHLGADTVTRRSLMGSSGRVGFVGAASTSWTLVEAASGRVTGGGAKHSAGSLTYDLETGQASRSPDTASSGQLPADPLRRVEDRVRTAVLVLALSIGALSAAGTVSLVIGWFTG